MDFWSPPSKLLPEIWAQGFQTSPDPPSSPARTNFAIPPLLAQQLSRLFSMLPGLLRDLCLNSRLIVQNKLPLYAWRRDQFPCGHCYHKTTEMALYVVKVFDQKIQPKKASLFQDFIPLSFCDAGTFLPIIF
ncbi:hypothetical protein EAE96_011346 [Botrytis aclada]|nr:hypothetical protein EAE96_011346 [Botrytis aclada]